MPNGQVQETIISPTQEPRSYRVTVPSGEVRRNHSHLRNRTSGNTEAVTSDNNTTVQRQIQNWHRDLTSTSLQELVLQLGGRYSIKTNHNAVIA